MAMDIFENKKLAIIGGGHIGLVLVKSRKTSSIAG